MQRSGYSDGANRPSFEAIVEMNADSLDPKEGRNAECTSERQVPACVYLHRTHILNCFRQGE
jgi:hypothetical protein